MALSSVSGASNEASGPSCSVASATRVLAIVFVAISISAPPPWTLSAPVPLRFLAKVSEVSGAIHAVVSAGTATGTASVGWPDATSIDEGMAL